MKPTATQCVVHLVTRRGLSPAPLAPCHAVRAEAGRWWTDLVTRHTQARTQGQWLSAGDLEPATKGGQYALHSQSVQALCQQLAATVAPATELRQQEWDETGRLQTEYPSRPKPFPTVVGQDQALHILPRGDRRLPTGGQRPPLLLLLPLPAASPVPTATRRRVALTWRADHSERCLTLETGETGEPVTPGQPAGTGAGAGGVAGGVAGVDLGAVPSAAVTTTRRHALVVSGRRLRSCKPWRNTSPARLATTLARCQPASRRAKRLEQAQATTSANVYRQERDLLHTAAQHVVPVCAQEGVWQLAVGEVRDIQTGVSRGTVSNQQIRQGPHGQFVRSLREQAARRGRRVDGIAEAYAPKTGCAGGPVPPPSPRGRRSGCAGCGARRHREVNGSATSCSKAAYGRYGQVQADAVKYLRPIGVVPPTRAIRRLRQ